MKPKKKICIECKREDYIFSKGRCKRCSQKTYKPLKTNSKLSSGSKLKKVSPKKLKALKERTKKRKPFFEKHIKLIKENGIRCEECNTPLLGGVDEVAHILSKNKHPEVEVNDLNVVYLCGAFSENQCHYNFDNKDRTKMKVFEIAKERFHQFKSEVKNFSKEKLVLEEN